jgi:alkanesulfonate monooxygenase SsuD/methylene tetrahydromethanopterin reductase-like flavin-dependent oxidoreductase (luciferase family)
MTGAPRIGIQLPEIERRVPWPEVREIARTAEDVGFDSIWVGDHLLYRDVRGSVGSSGPWEAWSSLAALAEATSTVKLGPLVAATAFHNPAMLAKMAATIDEISGGRLIVGLGAGWNPVEFEAFGFPYDQRVSRFEEAFSIIHALLTEGHVDFAGRYFTLRDGELQPPPRPGGPPILIGSNGRRMLTWTLPKVQMWNTWYASYGNAPAGLQRLVAFVDDICGDVDVEPSTVERTAAVLVDVTEHVGGGGEVRPRSDAPPVTGDAEMIADQLTAFAATGVTHLQLVVRPITASSVEWLGGVLASGIHATPQARTQRS